MKKKSGRRTRPTPAAVLDVISASKRPLNLSELAHRMKTDESGRRNLKRIVQGLLRSGRLSEAASGRFMAGKQKREQGKRHRPAPRSSEAKGKDQGTGKRRRAALRPFEAKGKDLVTGKLSMHRDGFGFVIPDEPVPGMEGDVFIPPPATADAMHGDRVRVRIRRRGRAGKVEGEIIQVERRAHATLVGILNLGPRGATVVPQDDRIRDDIHIPKDKVLPPGTTMRGQDLDGAVVNVEIEEYPRKGRRGAGRIVEVLGRPGDIGVDVEIVIRKYHLPQQFDDEVMEEAREIPAQPEANDVARRRDFRDYPIVTIDGETAKDFDDAVRVSKDGNGHYLLDVHIADVAHYVRPGTPLDREARLRGTSVYFPDRAVPMLPEELSNGVCSLRPDEDRLVMSCQMEIDSRGEVIRYWVGEGVIRSAARMTYTAVNAVLEGEPEALETYRALVPEFDRMRDLAMILNQRRERRGSIDFDLPDPVIQFDDTGRLTGITRSERNIANRIIEEFMLAANETVARFLTGHGVPMLYRVHEKPEPRKVLAFEEMAGTFGYSFGLAPPSVEAASAAGRAAESKHTVRVKGSRGRGHRQRSQEAPATLTVTPRHYQRVTKQIAGKPEERILSFLMLRSLKQAVYSERNQGHFALADPCYTHFTSPIRRYPDLIIHRLLKWAIRELKAKSEGVWFFEGDFEEEGQEGKGLGGPLEMAELRSIGVESSDAERRSDEAERELIELKKMEYMQQHLGDEFEGLIINVTRYGLRVELMDMFVEGLVPLETLDPAADYQFREATRSMTPGRKNRSGAAPSYRIGDRVKAQVDRVDALARQIHFSLPEQRIKPARRKR